MEYTSPSMMNDVPQMLALAISFAAAVIAAATYWRRQRASVFAGMHQQAAQNLGQIIYHDAPTVRVVDSQRIDRIRKVVQLNAGNHVDILETLPGDEPRFRITLKSVVQRSGSAAAHIVVEFCGAPVSCGPLVEEVAFNEFVLPRSGRDEPRSVVFHYHEQNDALDFMRVKVRNADAQTQTAEIDVMQVLGHWPNGRSEL